MKTAIFLYKPEQLVSLDALLAKWSTKDERPTIVSLDAEIDYALEKRGALFISGKTLQNRTAPSAHMQADKITRALYANEALSSLQYRGVSLMEPLRFSIHQYLQNLLYYVDVIERLMENIPNVECLVIPTSAASVLKVYSSLTIEESRIVCEAARLIAEGRGIRYESHETFSTAIRSKNRWQKWTFTFKRALFGASLSVLNALMALRPRRTIRVLASDYWRNIAPIMRELPEAELVLIDRTEALKAGFAHIWHHKIQFLHIEHFLSWRGKRQALAHAKKCSEEWMAARSEALATIDFTFRGTNLLSTVERILTRLIETDIPEIVCEIEGTCAMYERLSPDAVELRVSVSKQRHFIILPLVARLRGIPAVEVQHGIEYLGPGSVTWRLAAEYLAEYGQLVCDELSALGYAREQLFAVGSPRFDAYVRDIKKAARQMRKGVTILSNTPTPSVGERYGTYSIEECFKALGNAIRKIPNARLLIASRSVSAHAAFYEEMHARGLKGVNYENAWDAPLPGLFQQADIFVCSFSTVAYEALLYRLPVIIAAFAPTEKMMADFHFAHFVDAGALRIAHSPEELADILQELSADPEARARMSAAAQKFMKDNFSFDGHASKRIAKLIRNWSTQATT